MSKAGEFLKLIGDIKGDIAFQGPYNGYIITVIREGNTFTYIINKGSAERMELDDETVRMKGEVDREKDFGSIRLATAAARLWIRTVSSVKGSPEPLQKVQYTNKNKKKPHGY